MIAVYLLVVIIAAVKTSDTDSLIVTLPSGQISGRKLQSYSNNASYYAFQEIPYASPPVGDLRFKEPTPSKNWDGILNTTKNTKACWQASSWTSTILNEDCLYLNVYTPKKPENDSSDLLPVFFWIHGGGFEGGEGGFELFNPGFLIDYEIVVVTINYRVGPLGFLTTNDGVIPANLGLRDQIFALNWTNQNIHLFGGDPAKITIGGESAGAASVGYLLLSKPARGLFRGAVAQSGSDLVHWAHQPSPKSYAYQLGSLLSNDITVNSSSEELLEVLRNATASDITTLGMGLQPDTTGHQLLNFIWAPVMEDESLGDAVVAGPMDANLEAGEFNKVPALLGYNSEEDIAFVAGKDDPVSWLKLQGAYYDENLSRLIDDKFNMTLEDKARAGGQVRNIYTNGHLEDDPAAVLKFLSDEGINNGVIRHAALHSNYSDVYLYEFSYVGSFLYTNLTIEGADRVGHGEDLGYIWYYPVNPVGTDTDILTRNRILQLWTNFIKYLNPTPTKDKLLADVIWPKLSADNLTYLNINDTLDLKKNPKHYEEWKPIVDAYVIPPLITY